MKKIMIFLGFILLLSSQLQAQKVTGTITDASSGKTLPGVNISVKGTTRGTASDSKGNYELNVESLQDTLIISFIGFQKRIIPIGGRTGIDVSLKPKVYQGEELVVSGYQIQRKVDLTGAVSVVKTEDLEDTPSNNPIEALQGRAPGLFISTDGNPSGGAQVRIRGVNTLNNNDPLYIIDGVPTKSSAFQVLNSEDIQSIQVLKDASSAAIYGARASNGVIIVTTKQAEENALQFNVSSKVTQSTYATQPQVLNTPERAQVQWQATVNDGLDPASIQNAKYDWTTDSNGVPVLNGITIPDKIAPGYPSSNTNWFNVITSPGMIQEHDISMSTGSKNGGGLLSLRYYKNKYIEKYRKYEKISARINSHHKFFDGVLKVGENFTISNGLDKGYQGTDPFSWALELRPILPVRTEDGSYSGPPTGAFVDHPNALMTLDYNKWDQSKDVNMFGNLYANISILDNLEFKTILGLDFSDRRIRDIQRTFSTGFINRSINSLNNQKSENINWDLNSTLQYKLDTNKHKATFLAGYEAITNSYAQNSAYREGFALEKLDYFVESAGSGKQNVSGMKTGYSLLSYFGKINYSFNDKYLASATLRYDGSSRFGSNNRYGTFPSVSLGWRLSNENFISSNFPFVSNLKLRLGWGQTGNQEIANNAIFGLYDTHYGEDAIAFWASNGTAYDLNGADSGPLPSGFRKIQSGNSNLRWETTTEKNLGIDFGFFEQKLTGSVDYFKRNTNDILISPAYLAVRGEGGNVFVNGASVETNGFEVSLNYQNKIGKVSYTLSGNLGHYKDKITQLPENVINSYPGNSEKTILGHSMNSIFGYVADGIFQNQQEVDQHADQPGKGVGRIRYKDLNGDGVINTLDQKYLGASSPDYEYGFNIQANYKRFNLRVFLQGVQGIQVYDSRKRFTDFTSLWAGTNYGKRTLDSWTPNNTDTTIPAVTLTDSNDEGRMSTYFIENGSYLKLRELSLGYTLRQISVLDQMRIFITGVNLLTIKDTSGNDAFTSPDPENPGYAYPRPRKITIGVNFSF